MITWIVLILIVVLTFLFTRPPHKNAGDSPRVGEGRYSQRGYISARHGLQDRPTRGK